MIFFDDRFMRLSTIERKTLRAISEGMSVRDIAKHRIVSENTVRSQIRNVLMKLGVNSQMQASALFYQAQGKIEVRRCGMFFEVDPKGKVFVINGYPDAERNVQNLSVFFPDSIFFYAELTTQE